MFKHIVNKHNMTLAKWTYSTRVKPSPSSFLAPAKQQRLCSFFRSFQILLIEGEAPSKTHAFLCFQITKAHRIYKEFTPFLCSLLTLLIVMRHQSAKLSSLCRRTESARYSFLRLSYKLYKTFFPAQALTLKSSVRV